MATVVRPSFFVPNPPTDQIWSMATRQMGNPLLVPELTSPKMFGAPGQAQYKRPRWDNDVAESFWNAKPTPSKLLIPLLTSVKFFGAGGQAPTKRWHIQFSNNSAESDWNRLPQPSNFNMALRGVFVPVANAVRHLWDQDDSAMPWEFNLSTSMSLVLNGQFTPVAKASRRLWDQDDSAVPWEANLSVPFNLSLKGKFTPVATANPFPFNYKEFAQPWEPSLIPQRNFMLISQPPIYQIVPYHLIEYRDFFVPWGPDPHPSVNIVLQATLLPPNRAPIKPYVDNDQSGWQHTAALNLNLTGQPSPVSIASRWHLDTDDAGVWAGHPTQSQLLAPILTSGGQVKQPATPRPFGGVYNDDSSSWQKAVTLNYTLANTAVVRTQLRGSFVVPNPPMDVQWQAKPIPANPLLAAPVATSPFAHRQWPSVIDDPSFWAYSFKLNLPIIDSIQFPVIRGGAWSSPNDPGVWQYVSGRNAGLLAPQGATPFGVKRWLNDFDDQSGWQYKTPFNLNLFGSFVPISIPTRWRFNNDDSSGWQWVQPRPTILINTPAATPVANTRGFNFDESSIWVGASTPSKVLVPLLTNQPRSPLLPRALGGGYADDSSGWQWVQPVPYILLNTPIGKAFFNPRWAFGYNDAADWVGKPLPSLTLYLPITLEGPLHARYFFADVGRMMGMG